MNPPWTGLGRVESDIQQIQAELRGKAASHEVHTLSSRLDGLEREVREIRSEVDGFRFELQRVQEDARRALDILDNVPIEEEAK
jgi:outer membrane murein-binding lipoprotein Lpp